MVRRRGRRAAALVVAAAAAGALAPSAHAGMPPPGGDLSVGLRAAALQLEESPADPLAGVLVRARSGVAMPPGALDPPFLPARRPAEVLVRLGPDPLALAAALRLDPAGFWATASGVVIATGPGVSVRGRIVADGSARVSFTPTAPGWIRMRMYVPGKSIDRAKGITSWLVRPGEAPGSPLLEVIDQPDPAPDPGGEPSPDPRPVPAPTPGPEPSPVA
jgi:hypothetical protein